MKLKRNSTIPTEARKDIEWWISVICGYSGKSVIPYEIWSKPDGDHRTDACLTDTWLKDKFFHVHFPHNIKYSTGYVK